MTIDDAARAELAVAGAAVILVTPERDERHPSWLVRVPPDQLEMILAASPPNVQPGQLWLLGTEAADDVTRCREAIESLGGVVMHFREDVEIWTAVAAHLWREAELQRESQIDLRRENTALRRELNRALSALDERHPILGLLPSASLDDVIANRQPRVPPSIGRERPLMSLIAEVPGDLRSAQDEILGLREELAAIERTKLMRWSRLARQIYAQVRRI